MVLPFSRPLALVAIFIASVAANNVLDVNPPVANADITTHGSDFLWAVFSVMLASALGVTVWALMIPPGKRAFHFIGIAILFTASIAYFSMASDLGSTAVTVEFVRYKPHLFTDRNIDPYTRSIWYARYIDWFVTTPLLLLELLLGTGMPLSGIFATIFFDVVMVVAGLIGALVPTRYKWGYFAGGCVALFYVTWALIFPGRANARALGAEAYKAYMSSAVILSFLWFLYPIAWGLCDAGNVIPTDSEFVFYGVLDLLAKPVFLFLHLFALRKVPYETFQLQSGHYSAYASIANGVVSHTGDSHVATGVRGLEKAPLSSHTPAVGNAAVQSGHGVGTNTGVGLRGHQGAHASAGPTEEVHGGGQGQMHVAGRPSDATAV